MLNFSSDAITFPFVENNHLKTTLILANDSTSPIYFKVRPASHSSKSPSLSLS